MSHFTERATLVGRLIRAQNCPQVTSIQSGQKSNPALTFMRDLQSCHLLRSSRSAAASLPTINNRNAGKKYASPTKQIHFLKRNKSKRGRARLPRGWFGQSITHALDVPPLADTCFSTLAHFSTLDEVLMVVRRFFPFSKSQKCIPCSSPVSALVQRLLMIATEAV